MANLLRRLRDWLQERPAPQEAALAATAASPGVADAAGPTAGDELGRPGFAPGATASLAEDLRIFQWLTQGALVAADEPSAIEYGLLAHLDAVLRSSELREDLVPRARSIIPQLMHSLRDPSQSVQSLAARIARDPNLVVEVIRAANSVAYRADGATGDLLQAIARLGTEGVRRAIARVLLKPIFDAQADPLLGAAAERLWRQSELKATLCMQQAASVNVESFEAYLVGLMHNVGWTAAFRAIDRSAHGAPHEFTHGFVRALDERRERLFAQLARSWQISDTLTQLAEEILARGLPQAESALARLLRVADLVSARQLMQEAARPAGA